MPSASRSSSPPIDDIEEEEEEEEEEEDIDFEDELQQELENEMSASYDNLFEDDFAQSRSPTGHSSVAGDSEVDADLFGSDIDSDDEDDLDLNFEDPPDAAASANPPPELPVTTPDEDSASDDEFEAVESNAAQLAQQPVLDHTSAADTSHQRRLRNQVGDRCFLERFKDEVPSMVLHMLDTHFRFEGQDGAFHYNGPMRFFFDAMNDGVIPIDLVDVFAQLSCRYYEGCLIVEVRDYRRPDNESKLRKQNRSELLTWSAFGASNSHSYRFHRPSDASPLPSHVLPEPGTTAANSLLSNASTPPCRSSSEGVSNAAGAKIFRKVLRPTPETLNLDLRLACEQTRVKLSQSDMLEMEGMLLLAVEEPLDLDPDFQVSRISNATRFVEYEHLLPHKRRKYNSAEIEAEKTEREEKLKLLTLMDDRKNHGEFLPSFNRVSFINEWRHKKYVSDGEVYPAALPPPAMPPAAGKKTAAKRSRSQMSMFADGRRVVRTLRFVQTINGRLIYTVFHVLELPDGGLQGVMRWGTLPDTSINGGSKVFAFPDEEIMRMHIDNFKLLLHIENNRLVYDSAYPNGIPTADLPPPLLATPTVSPRTSANPVPTASPAVGTGVAAAASAVSSPAIASSSVAQSPDIASVASPPAKDAQKSKSSVAKKGAGARNSRKNSPSKSKSAIARPASAEVELDTSPPPKSTKGLHKAKASAEAKRRAAAAAAKEESPVSVSSTDSATALVEGVSTKDGDAENAAVVPKPKKSASKASLSSLSQTTVGDEGGKTPTAAKEKKGAQAKAPRKTPTTKEKKPRAKAKSAAASKDSAAALLPATESAELAPSLSVNDDVSAVGAAASTGDGAFASDDDDAPLVQNPDSTAATGARSASNEAPLAQTPAAGAAAPLLVSSSPATASTPAAANPSAGQAPMAQAALAQFNLQLAAMAQGGAGRPPFEMPKHITKEYLQAHPEYLAMLRQQMAHVLLQQRQQFQQQQQQQQLQAASNMSNSSAGPMGSPQIRPNAAAHPNMSAMAHMMQSMQNSPASAVAGGPVPQTAGNTGMPAVASTSPMNPTLGSPTMRPAVGLPGAPNGITAAQIQQLQQLQPTNEELAIIQQYLRIKGIQLQGVQDPRFLILVAKAKTGELKSMLLTHIQALASQQQQQQQQQQQHQQSSVPVQNSPALANPLPANPAPALAMNQVPGAVGQQQAVRPMQLPLDPANLSLQDRARLLELVQKQREAQLNGAAPGSMPNPLGAPTQPQPALAAAMAAAALQRQQQQQLGLAAANPAGAVSAMQAQMARSVQLPGAAGPAQPRPAAPMLGSPSSAPANAPQSAMALAQRQALQQAALANMSPQQRQEAIQRIQQAAAMAATVNRAPQVNVPIILQQLSSGQISPAMMPPHLISFLLHNAQAQLTPEQRVALQRILALHMQQQQAQNNAAAGPIRPGAAQ